MADDFATFEGLHSFDSIQLRPRPESPLYVLTAETNQPPTADPDSATTSQETSTAPISVLANDADPDRLPGDTLELESFSQARMER